MQKRNVAREVLDKFGVDAAPAGVVIPRKNCAAAIKYLWDEIEDEKSKKDLLPYVEGRKPKTMQNVNSLVYYFTLSREGLKVI